MKLSEVNRDELSPMMQQYMDIKMRYNDDLLFFRLGDFYELFFEDAEITSHELELTLTGKNAGLKERVPMCGVPHHAVKSYIEKLINKGYKVAICEQLEDPRFTKGMVKRDVIEVITKGTMVDLEFLNERDFNYIASVIDFNYVFLVTYIDISTGEVNSIMIEHDNNKLLNELLSINVKEVIVNSDVSIEIINSLNNNYNINISISDDYSENDYKSIYEGIEDERVIKGLQHLIYYLHVKELKDLSHLSKSHIREFFLSFNLKVSTNSRFLIV